MKPSIAIPLLLIAAAPTVAPARPVLDLIAPNAVRATMMSVADWQLENPSKHPPTDWTQGAMYTGMMALDGISPSPRYHEAMRVMGEGNAWKPGPRTYMADDHAVGQTYVELYEVYRETGMIRPLIARFDEILAAPPTNAVLFAAPVSEATRRWCWCDALFMAPPAWLRVYRATGDARYRDFAVSNWWETSAQLYDREEHLYYRDARYIPQREANGRKVFWSRGNGWVLAGLARVLEVLPADDPDRPRFVQQFREMAEAVRAAQQPDGLWRSSLLDPASYPLRETSGTGFFAYGLAWGINHGLLDRTAYLPAVTLAWKGMVKCVDENGRLSHVQPIGADPKKFDENHTDAYGVGAFLLAGAEIYRLALLEAVKSTPLQVRNPVAARRASATVELSWTGIVARLPGLQPAEVSVLDDATSRYLDAQVVDLDGDETPDQLLFQSDFMPVETRRFLIVAGLKADDRPQPVLRTYARFVPERKDDFAWENDRIAFRMYGPALQNTPGEVSGSGIDVWLKSTRKPVIDAWYASGKYHEDHGEGLDAYKVGTSRGCGGLAIQYGDQYAASANFATWKLISAGPVRALFELTYAPWAAGPYQVRETKRVSLDRGCNWNQIESRLSSDLGGPLSVVIGLAKQAGDGALLKAEAEGWLAYSGPASPPNGQTHTAMILPGTLKPVDHPEQWLAARTVRPNEPLVYWAGAGWSKADYPTPTDWQRDVQLFAFFTRHPLQMAWESATTRAE